MNISVNGTIHSLEEETSVSDFLHKEDIDPKTVVIEHNKIVVKNDDYHHLILEDKDQLEILRFVGGG